MLMWKFINKIMNTSFDEKAYEENYEHIAKSNIRFYRIYNWIMIGLMALLLASTFFSDYAIELRVIYVIFIAISFIEMILLKVGILNKMEVIPYTIYFGIAKSYIFCILSSVIYNRESNAITFLIFMVLLPISFVLKPVIMCWSQTIVTIIFCITTLVFKPIGLASGDVIACISFYVISFVIAAQINNLRVGNIRMIEETHKYNEELMAQRDLLGVTLEIAKLCNVPEQDFKENASDAIRLVREQYEAKRAYLFEFDWEKNLMSNTYESISDGVTSEIDSLQNLPIDMISYWMDLFREEKEVFITDIETIKVDSARAEEYETLKAQGIDGLLVIPISRNKHLYGYIGVDDPQIRKNEHEFIMNVAQLLSQEFYACEQQNRLVDISLKDSLTGLKNRYSYEEFLDTNRQNEFKSTGIIFADVNGLKYVNDVHGHSKGDLYIKEAARVLVEYFENEEIFRISGDEFVIICKDIECETFMHKVETMEHCIDDEHNSILAIGCSCDNGDTILEMIRHAETNMYINKKEYYKKNPDRNRRH